MVEKHKKHIAYKNSTANSVTQVHRMPGHHEYGVQTPSAVMLSLSVTWREKHSAT